MEIIIELINKIESIGDDHSEVYDTDVKESIYLNLIESIDDRPIKSSFGMFTEEGNTKLKLALEEFGKSVRSSGLPPPKIYDLLNSTVIKSSRGQHLEVFWGTSKAALYPRREGLNYKLARLLNKPYTFPLVFIIPSVAIFILLKLLFPGIFQYQLGLVAALITAGVGGLIGGVYLYEKLRSNRKA